MRQNDLYGVTRHIPQEKKTVAECVAGVEGIEPPALGFGDRCSTAELHPYLATTPNK